MIIEIRGYVITHRITGEQGFIDVMTSSGIGYRVHVPSNYILLSEGDEISMFTSFKVKEDSQDLYGFNSVEERDLFETLTGVSGIGPKIALSILSMYGSDKVKELILSADHVLLSKVKGLGPKGAKKIILELSGVLSSTDEEEKEAPAEILKELKEALSALGFTGGDAKSMIEKGKLIYEEDPSLSIEALLQKVLRGE